MVVCCPCPQVAAIVAQVASKTPGRQLIRVASWCRYVGWCDAIACQVGGKVGSIELHRTDVVRAVGVAHPLAGLAAFLLSDSQDQVGWHVIAGGSDDGAHNTLVQMGREIERHRSSVARLRRENGL